MNFETEDGTALFPVARFDSGKLRAVTSELTVAEVLVKPLRDGNSQLHVAFERMLQSSGSLTMVPVSRMIWTQAAAVRATSPLKFPDAIHAATAIEQGCTSFLANDRLFGILPALPILHLPDLK